MQGELEKNNQHQHEIKPGQSGFFYAHTKDYEHERQRRKDLGL